MICNVSKGSMARGRMTGIKGEDQGRQMGRNNEGGIDKGWIGLPRSREEGPKRCGRMWGGAGKGCGKELGRESRKQSRSPRWQVG